ncbi:MAG: 16S rRNA processing protein RimM [Alloprevotella sp.]|nr:16S rRNA processing protein RimM [Alloprevotella sp.]
MIREEEVFPIGRITRQRGTGAELEMTFTDDALDRGSSEYIVLRMDGILVPFFWEEYKFKNDRQLILRLEDVTTSAEAQRLVGAEVYYPLSELPEDDAPTTVSGLTGYAVEDAAAGALGRIRHVDDRSQNILLYVETKDGQELILPYHEDLVVDFDSKKKLLTLQLPEGLLDTQQ